MIRAIDGKIGPDDVANFYETLPERFIVPKGGTSAGSMTLDGQ